MCPHADATTTCQDNFHVSREVNGLGVSQHFFHVLAIDGARQVERLVSESPGTQPVVGSHDACPSTEADDTASIRSLDQFVVNQANTLVDDGSEQFGVVGLQLVRVAEKEIRGVIPQLIQWHFFHSQQDVASLQVGDNVNALLAVFVVANSTNLA